MDSTNNPSGGGGGSSSTHMTIDSLNDLRGTLETFPDGIQVYGSSLVAITSGNFHLAHFTWPNDDRGLTITYRGPVDTGFADWVSNPTSRKTVGVPANIKQATAYRDTEAGYT